ncbi:MAG TPA: prepilin-type N-terminal cleavage/methylation domain-containing protein [Gemmatimonadaceae bacterium]|nr:prepilin-type N-terminal cleavage/methylation domain-containing protein [Gemmatimonadaceae bacterium]
MHLITPSAQIPSAPSVRRGITLPEMMVVLVLLGLVVGGLMTVLVRQQRFYTGTSEIIATKGSARQAVDILSSELRGISTGTRNGAPNNVDIYAMSDSSLTFRSQFGGSVVCTIDPTRTIVTLPPRMMGAQNALTSFLSDARAGDSIFVFDQGPQPGTNDDRWQRVALARDPGAGPCPVAPVGFTATAAEEAAGIEIVLTNALNPDVALGAPVRFFRPASYSLYQGSGGDWWLGYFSCPGNVCTARQAVSGPYQPYAGAGGPSGLAFAYFDSTGAVTADPRFVARIDVVARSQSQYNLDVANVRNRKYQDSLGVSIAVRNRI